MEPGAGSTSRIAIAREAVQGSGDTTLVVGISFAMKSVLSVGSMPFGSLPFTGSSAAYVYAVLVGRVGTHTQCDPDDNSSEANYGPLHSWL